MRTMGSHQPACKPGSSHGNPTAQIGRGLAAREGPWVTCHGTRCPSWQGRPGPGRAANFAPVPCVFAPGPAILRPTQPVTFFREASLPQPQIQPPPTFLFLSPRPIFQQPAHARFGDARRTRRRRDEHDKVPMPIGARLRLSDCRASVELSPFPRLYAGREAS